MIQKVLLPVRVPGTIPAEYRPVEADTTATAGLYVTAHPEGEDGWVHVTAAGAWIANYVRWRTPEDAQAVAAALGQVGVEWTAATEGELIKAYPDFRDRHWEVVEQFDDRRYPTVI